MVCTDATQSLNAEEPHLSYVRHLPFYVCFAHVHGAVKTEQGRGSGRGQAVLSRTCFSDDPLFAHVFGQERLPDGIVYLVGAGVQQVLPLEKNVDAVFF